MTEAIRPCPFCGSEAQYFPALMYVSCRGCSASGSYKPEAEAIAAWNTRAAIAPLQARIERLEAINAELLEKLGSINRLTSPGNRTFDDLCRDMGYACDIARATIAKAHEGEAGNGAS